MMILRLEDVNLTLVCERDSFQSRHSMHYNQTVSLGFIYSPQNVISMYSPYP